MGPFHDLRIEVYLSMFFHLVETAELPLDVVEIAVVVWP